MFKKYGRLIDNSIMRQYVNLIRNAVSFIYLENQYFIGSAYSWLDDQKTLAPHTIPRWVCLMLPGWQIANWLNPGRSLRRSSRRWRQRNLSTATCASRCIQRGILSLHRAKRSCVGNSEQFRACMQGLGLPLKGLELEQTPLTTSPSIASGRGNLQRICQMVWTTQNPPQGQL